MDTVRSPWLPLLALAALACAAGAGEGAAAAPRGEDTVVILHTNDLHTYLLPGPDDRGGLARIGGYVERLRAERPDVILLNAGDGPTGTPASSLFAGRPVFHVMNAVGYDASALGNHEFDYGWERVGEYREIAAFPILCANARAPGGALLADEAFRVFDVDGVRVGVVGLVTETTPAITTGGAVEGCRFEAPAAALRPLLPRVRAASDLVVVLSHLGHEEDVALASAVPGIDVIVGGHTHTVLREPVKAGGTLVVQAGEYGKYLGRLDLRVDLDAGRVISSRGRLLSVKASMVPSGKVAAAVEAWEERVRERVDVKIGEIPQGMDEDALYEPICEIFRAALSADLGYQNAGGVRGSLPAGDVTIRGIWNVLPFENTLVTLRVRGSKLPRWAVTKLGKAEPDRVYTVATNSYVCAHLDRFFPGGVEGQVDSGISMRQAVIDHVRRTGSISAARPASASPPRSSR